MVEGRVRDVGQVMLLMLVVIVCSGLLAIAVGALGGTLRDRPQASRGAAPQPTSSPARTEPFWSISIASRRRTAAGGLCS
jgi:hypothetical protein